MDWNTLQGVAPGHVVKKTTSRGKIKGHTVAASKDDPEYVVESDKTGKRAAHQRSALKKH